MSFKLHYCVIIFITYFVHLSITATPDKYVNPHDVVSNYAGEWVDPHDMRPSKEYLKYTNNPSSLHKENLLKNGQTNQLIEMYYKRTINMLLNSVHEDNNEIDTYCGYLYFKINTGDYKRLKQFADNMEYENDLVKINSILEEILIKPSHQHIQEFLQTWFHKFLNIALSREGIFTIILLSYIIIIYQMIKANFNLRYIFSFFLINVFIYDFIFTWIHLYQKTEIEYMVHRMKYKDVPVECNPEKMSSWHFLWNLIKIEDECQNYHHVTYQDIFWKVSPGAVLTEMFSRSIEQPASAFGNAFGNICAAIYNKLPWPVNIFIFPIAMIFFCLMVMITLSFVFKRNLHFNFLHLFSFSNSVATTCESNSDRLTDQNVERLLRIAESQQQQNRVFIEEIHVVPSTINIGPSASINSSASAKIFKDSKQNQPNQIAAKENTENIVENPENIVEISENTEMSVGNSENSEIFKENECNMNSDKEGSTSVLHRRYAGGGDFN